MIDPKQMISILPPKENNIYPKTDENLQSLISFYFDEFDIDQEGTLELLIRKTSLKLNQIEFLSKEISEAMFPIFKKHFKNDLSLTNLFHYAFDAMTDQEINGSGKRVEITKEFRQFLFSRVNITKMNQT